MTALAVRPRAGTAPLRWRVVPPVVCVLAALAAAGVYLAFVRTRLGQVVDEAAMRGATVQHPRVISVLNGTLDRTSLGTLAVVALIAAAIGLARRRVDLAVAAGVLVLAANLTTELLKDRLHRPPLGDPAPNSLPSGHTTAAVSVTFALVLVLPYAMRAALALAGTAYVTIIAVATVWAGWHRPSDTVAALLVTLAWGALVMSGLRLRSRRPSPGRPASRLVTLPLALGGATATLLGLLGLAAVALSVEMVPDLVPRLVAFVAAAAGVAGTTAVTFLVWLYLVADDEPA